MKAMENLKANVTARRESLARCQSKKELFSTQTTATAPCNDDATETIYYGNEIKVMNSQIPEKN